MTTTKIEWTDKTWNPVTGCTPISPGCAHCYAKRMAKRLAGRCGYPQAPHEFDVTLHPDRLDEPAQWRKPARVFVCSMSDLFHDDVPRKFIHGVFDVMINTPQHTFQVLTKRPERMAHIVQEYFYLRDINGYDRTSPGKNIWFGVTAENQEQADARIPLLLEIPAVVRFVSIEPMLGPVGLTKPVRPMCDGKPCWPCSESMLFGLDWVICGGETGPGARPFDVMWAASLLDQCSDAGVPFFYKGAGTAQYSKDDPQYRKLSGKLYEEYPEVAR